MPAADEVVDAAESVCGRFLALGVPSHVCGERVSSCSNEGLLDGAVQSDLMVKPDDTEEAIEDPYRLALTSSFSLIDSVLPP